MIEPEIFSLPNGTKLLYHQGYQPNITHIVVMVKSGSRQDAIPGTAHLLEHLLFKRTKKHGTFQILNRLESIGGELNAFTNKEYICLYASVRTNYTQRALSLLAEIIFECNFNDKDLVLEQSVVLDEILSYADIPEELIFDEFDEMVFTNTSLQHPIMGSAESVQSITKNVLHDYLKTAFSADNMVVGISSRKLQAQWLTFIEKHFTPYKKQVAKTEKVIPALVKTEAILKKPIGQCHVIFGAHSWAATHPDRTSMMLLSNILGGPGMTSRLNYALRERNGLTYNIDASYTPYIDTGLFTIYLATDKSKLKKAMRLVDVELHKLMDKSVSAKELKNQQDKLAGQVTLAEENSQNVLTSMCRALLEQGRVETLKEAFDRLYAITPQQLQTLAQWQFDPTKIVTLQYHPA